MVVYQQITFTTFAMAFGILHSILFLYNRKSISNLYFSLGAFFFAASIFLDFQALQLRHSETQYFYLRIHRIILPYSPIFLSLFVYSLIKIRIPKYFWTIAAGLSITGIVASFELENFKYFLIFLIAIFIEAIRLVIAGWRKKTDGAWIVGTGFAALIIFSLYDVLLDLNAMTAINNIENGYPYGFLALFISMSIYLARDLSKTNEKLQEYSQTLEDKVEERTKALKEAQDQLILSENMASLGKLAAGIAHEVNNPIGAVRSAADVNKRCIDKINNFLESGRNIDEIKSNHQFKKSLKILEENDRITSDGSERITNIVKSLKSFARLDEAEFQRVNIHDGLDSSLSLLSYEINSRIRIKKEYGKIPEIDCYPIQLNQVFMNILTNAVKAIDGEGEISISTKLKGNKVVIQISDTGCGISSENIPKIFKPGFTTRGVGVGTGLGLSICYNTIRKHNGDITVESKIGEGTTFTILLPTDFKEVIETS